MALNEQNCAAARVNDLLVGLVGHPRMCALDTKKRFTVSTEWRALLGASDYVYVMPDLYLKCLNLLSPEEMEKRLMRLRDTEWSAVGLSDALRRVGASSEMLKLDVQRRIRVCDRLLRFAAIEDKVVLAPAVTCVQLWSPSLYPDEEDVNQAELAKVCRRKFRG